MKILNFSLVLLGLLPVLPAPVSGKSAPRWEPVELTFTIHHKSNNPYTDVDAKVVFTHDTGETIVRPVFWKGGSQFAARFASTKATGKWDWQLVVDSKYKVDSDCSGSLDCAASHKDTAFQKHGYWTIPKGSRRIVHTDGTAVVLVGDTAWALPWRATPEQAMVYARDRQGKGFNAVLLMTIQPDMKAQGPRDRTRDFGFDVAFEDLPDGHINILNPQYFDKLDVLMRILVDHGIVPVFQPVFHGYGWKGLDTAGNIISGEEYARFCKYLVARYGADPAIWLVGGDGIGDAPGLDPGGKAIEQWDAYEHPTGIHYAPHGFTDSHQDADWLDFQWAQTGHNGEHLPEVAARLYLQQPVKASANAEPTYENHGEWGRAAGWWQGHEAWSNLCAGGTMGVVYGAGSLWNWILHPGEPGHNDWTIAPGAGWREALDFEGSSYVGNVGRILRQFDTGGLEPTNRIAPARRALWDPGKLLVVYIQNGTKGWFPKWPDLPQNFRLYDPRTAAILAQGNMPGPDWNQLSITPGEPCILILFNKEMLRDPS